MCGGAIPAVSDADSATKPQYMNRAGQWDDAAIAASTVLIGPVILMDIILPHAFGGVRIYA